MLPSALEKVLMGVAGAAGAGVLAWQTQFPWIKYDLQYISTLKKAVAVIQQRESTFLIDLYEAQVASNPKKAMLIFEDSIYTYEFIDQQANRVANVMRQFGLKCNDTVAMMMHSEPAHMWTLLGLQKLGVSVALINNNLRSKPLSHSVLATEPKAFIVGPGEDLLHTVSDVLDDLKGLPVYVQGLPTGHVPEGMADFDALMLKSSPATPHRFLRSDLTPDSTAIYIYTSGTTGLPKPVFMRHRVLNRLSTALAVADITSEDIVYLVLPLYHTVGGGFGFYSALVSGCTMVLKKKFSASEFWPDCRKYDVTIVLYIGEIFRYILAQPKHALDGVHKVRALFGNGMRKDIYQEVLDRFKIPKIFEFFGATDGPAILLNCSNKPGAIGRISPFLNYLDSDTSVLVKFDYSTAAPIRDRNGHCIRVKPGEPGLFLGKIPEENHAVKIYKASKDATEKKLVPNALRDGDLYFNFGDVMILDKDYFAYFHDRMGDTFRWKGENVSTTEVANIITVPSFVNDANVYGVQIPGHDGRAGMVAVTLNEGETITADRLKEVYKVCQDNLPSYARPLFLRILPEAVLTGTFKNRKVELIEEGYDMTKVKDELYFLDSKSAMYSPLTPEGLASFLQSKL